MPEQETQLNTTGSDYIYKKIDKLASALYLLSSFISDKEPVKWQMREAVLKLLAQSLSLSDRQIQGVSLITLILSYLNASYLGGIISQMNYNILKFEFENLVRLVEQEEKEKIKGAVFPEQFFKAIPNGNKNVSSANVKDGNSLLAKGQLFMSDRMSVRNKDSNRPSVIMSLLKDRGELGIKDFASAIKGCSEKTIQRDLAVLVSKGIVLKHGEKRWSRYLLK